jgi:outer membrane immunogenic protein
MSIMNNKILSVFLSLLALSSATFADTPASAKASSKSTYDWTGVYVGGYVGGATGSDVSNSPSKNVGGESGDWNYPGNENNNYSTKAGFIGGGTVGYNWQIGNTPYLIGLEGEYGYLSQKGSKQDPNAALNNSYYYSPGRLADNSQSSTSIGADYGYGLVGGRLGYALDRSLIYIKSGAVFTTVNSNWSDTNIPGYMGTSSKSTTTGYALGAGVEYALPFENFTHVTIKTEYLYMGIPTSQSLSENGSEGEVTTTQTTSGIHTAKIGVNYKF